MPLWMAAESFMTMADFGCGYKGHLLNLSCMTVTVPIPDNLDEALVRELDQAAREAVAVRLYREGKLSHGQFASFLGIGRGQADEVLGRHGVVDEFTADQIAAQVQASRSLRQQAHKQ
ncbi:MAG: UPF0175 family protein [Planctomycetes bacterium]|nr:UPF0175 family protein [Planctomycetota bacterium]